MLENDRNSFDGEENESFFAAYHIRWRYWLTGERLYWLVVKFLDSWQLKLTTKAWNAFVSWPFWTLKKNLLGKPFYAYIANSTANPVSSQKLIVGPISSNASSCIIHERKCQSDVLVAEPKDTRRRDKIGDKPSIKAVHYKLSEFPVNKLIETKQ